MTGVALVTQSKAHPLSERGHDLYETPEVATRALLRCENIPHRIWEPACGRGAIVRVLTEAGHDVCASDLVQYGFPGAHAGRDFLRESSAPAGYECVVTNPPFKLATEFVECGLRLVPRVIILARLAFIEGAKRVPIMGKCSRVHAFINRLPMMHRDGWEGPKSSSATAFAWFVFDRGHNAGVAELHWIRWEAA